ncbi:hypothetical protein D6C88_09613 [Aureobasidium pullulans]|nr:hypothetical protein D6C88_09613 [Aureobasidium pullulans]
MASHPCHLKCIYLELYQAKYHDVQCYTKEFDDYFILEHFAKHDIDDEQSYQIEQDDRLNQDYQIEQDDRLNQDYQIKFDLIELSNKEFHYAEFLIIKHVFLEHWQIKHLLEQVFFEYHFLKQDHFEQVFFEYHFLKQDHRLEFIERNFLYDESEHEFLEYKFFKHNVSKHYSWNNLFDHDYVELSLELYYKADNFKHH